jgi:hypothetical protein
MLHLMFKFVILGKWELELNLSEIKAFLASPAVSARAVARADQNLMEIKRHLIFFLAGEFDKTLVLPVCLKHL